MKTKYLIVTNPIDPEVAQARKDADVAEAEDCVRCAQEELAYVLAKPLEAEREFQIEVGPEHPDYDKASDAPDMRFFMGEWGWLNDQHIKKLINADPWYKLLEPGVFPENMGDTK